MATARQALLFAGLAVLLADIAQVGAFRRHRDPAASQERERFARCTWPLDPLDLGRRFTPKGNLMMQDSTTMLAVVLFFTIGAGAMCTDFLELAEDEEPQEGNGSSTKSKDRSPSASKPSRSMLPTALAIVVLSLVASSGMPAPDPSPVPCHRLPVLAPSLATLLALSDDAVEELMQLRALALPQKHAGDASTATLVLAFFIVGLGTMHVDAQEIALEAERAPSVDSRTCEGRPPCSSNRRAGKRSSRCSSRTLLCVAVAVMAVLAAVPTTRSNVVVDGSISPSSNDVAVEELVISRTKTVRVIRQARGRTPKLRGAAAPDGVAALIISVIAAVGCKVCHSDLIDMQEEEKQRQQKHANRQQNAQPESLSSPPSSQDAERQVSAFGLPMVLRIALALAAVGNVVLLCWGLQTGFFHAGSLKSISPSPQQQGAGQIVWLSVPFVTDEVTVLACGIFSLLGLVAFCIDFRSFLEEESAKAEVCSSKESKKMTGATTCGIETVQDRSWLEYLSTHWRMVSCIALLFSVFASAATALWDTTM